MHSRASKPKITAEESRLLESIYAAWRELIRLGWKEPRYFRWPKEGVEFELIELGSIGIHRAVKRGLDPEKTCWVDYQWPSQPFLVRQCKESNHEKHDVSESASPTAKNTVTCCGQTFTEWVPWARHLNVEHSGVIQASPQPSPQTPPDAVEAEITHFIANFDCPCCGFPNCGHEHHSDTKKILKEALAKLKTTEAVPSPDTATPDGKIGKWIHAEELPKPEGRVTKIWSIREESCAEIGQVRWFGKWRCYGFFPGPDTVFERTCLRDLAAFCEAKTNEHRSMKP